MVVALQRIVFLFFSSVLASGCTDGRLEASVWSSGQDIVKRQEKSTPKRTADPRPRLPAAIREDAGKKALALARKCAAAKPYGNLGVHRSALLYERATFDTPADAKARGDRSQLARRGDEFVLVVIPESPPLDERTPNGRQFLVNLKTGKCQAMPMR
jgi:hypothetical protein